MGNSLVFTRKALAGAATVAILASQLVVAPMASAAEMQFSDVPANEWYTQYVAKLTEMGVIEGYSDGTYKPNNSVNRAEMSKIATKLATMTGVIKDANDMSGAAMFSDVPADQWFYGYVSVLSKAKILEGYRDANGNLTGRFGPGDFVNRAEASKILLLAAGIPSKLTPATPFIDVNPSDWFYEYVTSAYNWSILDGYKLADNKTLTGYFGPGDQVTRAQIAKIAVLAQNPVDRVTQQPINSNSNAVSNSNQNMTNGNTNVPMSKVSFEAALSSATPAMKTLATGTAYNDVLKVDLTAGNDEDVKVTHLTLNQTGLSTSNIVSGVLVIDRDGMRHGNVVSFSSTTSGSKAMIDMSSNPIMVKAGTTHTITIQVNLDRAALINSGTFGVAIASDGIKAMGATSNGMVAVKGGFPIAGPQYSVVDGTNVIAGLDLDLGLTYGQQELDLGAMNKPISSFKLQATGADEGVEIRELTVYNNGTSADGDVKNLKLVSPEGNVLATVEQTSNRYATFNLANPYVIPSGNTRNLAIHVDVVNGSSRTVEFLIMNDYDVKAQGQNTDAYILPVATGNFPVGDTGANRATIKEGTLTLARATTSPSGEIANGVTETIVGEYKVEAFGEDIEIQGGTFTVDWSAAAKPFTGSVRIMNASGATIHSISANSVNDNTAIAVSKFNNFYTVKAGTAGMLRVVVDVAETAEDASTIVATMQDLNIKKLASNKFGTVNTTVAGNSLTITTANMIVSKNTATASEDIVAGGTQQLIGAFDIKATNTGDVLVNSVKLNIAGFANVSNLKVKVGDTWLGSPVATPTASDNTFTFAGQLTVPKSATRTVMVYADVSTNAMGNITVTVPANGVAGTAQNVSVTAPALAAALQTYAVVASGDVVVSATNTVSNSRVVTSGATNEAIMSFKVKAEDREAMRLNKLKVEINNESGVASPASVQSVTLMRNGQMVGTPTGLLLSGGDYTAEFTGLNQQIARNMEAEYSVVLNFVNTNAFVSGGEISASVVSYEATGVASGQLVINNAANVNGFPILTLHKVTPVIAKQAIATTATPAPETNVAAFSVTASGTEAMQIEEMTFGLFGSISATADIEDVILYRVTGNTYTEVATLAGPFVKGDAITFAGLNYDISAGQTANFVVRADTSDVFVGTTNETVSLSLAMAKNAFEYSYTGVALATAPTDNTIVFDTVKF